MTSYTYTVTPPYDTENLANNINNSSIITTGLIVITVSNTNLTVTFQSTLSTPEENELINLVNNNDTIIKICPISSSIIIVISATTTSGTLSTDFVAGQIIDGVTLIKNDLILIKNQTNAIENGIYSVKLSGAPERINLFSNTNAGGTIVLVNQGTTNAGKLWICTNTFGSDIVGTDDLTFSFYNPITPTQVQMTFSDNIKSGLTFQPVLSNIYNSIKTFMYTFNKNNPIKFKLVYSISSSTGSFDFRIQDITNANTIAQLTGLTNTSGSVTTAETTTFTNMPTSDALFEIQYSETSGNKSPIVLYTAYFEYS